VVDVSELAIVSRAKDYPFTVPGYSYIFSDGKIIEFAELKSPLGKSTIKVFQNRVRLVDYLDFLGLELADLVPVLVYGSNASNAQLEMKFSGLEGIVIPVELTYTTLMSFIQLISRPTVQHPQPFNFLQKQWQPSK